MPNEIYDFYENGAEIGRLERGLGRVEAARTKELLSRLLPATGKICDVGGGIGYYSDWLAGRGYDVTMIELAPTAVAYARAHQTHPYRAEVGNALALTGIADNTMDAVLLMGPLYHLLKTEGRAAALKEARRILKPGGVLIATAISKFSSATWALSVYGTGKDFIDDPIYMGMLEGELTKGEHHRPKEYPNFIAEAFFHEPAQLAAELTENGFKDPSLYAIEGIIWFCPGLQEKWDEPIGRARLEALLAMTEQEPSVLGMSPHILCAATK